MTLMIHWIGALSVGAAGGVLCTALLCGRRLTAKSLQLRIERKINDQLHLQIAHKHREYSLLERHHEEETKLWLRSVKLLEEAGAATRLHQRHYDAVLECKERELRESRQTVVGVEEMSERLREFEDFAVIVRGHLVASRERDFRSTVSETLILEMAEKLVPGPILSSIEEVERSDKEERQAEEAATAGA